MIRKISNIFMAIRYAYCWMRVREFVSKEKYSYALDYLNKIHRMKPKQLLELYLTRGFVYYAIDDVNAKNDLRRSIELISSSSCYSSNEKNYLLMYAVTLYQDILSFNGEQSESDKMSSLYDYDSIDFDLIDKKILRHFPLRDHDRWKAN